MRNRVLHCGDIPCSSFSFIRGYYNTIRGGDAGSELRNIDEAINEMSGKISELQEASDEERVSASMRESLGE